MAYIDYAKMKEPFVEIRLEGLPLPAQFRERLLSAAAVENRDKPDTGSLVFNDMGYLISDCNLFLPGQQIALCIGYREDWRGYTFLVDKEPALRGDDTGHASFTVNLVDGALGMQEDEQIINYPHPHLSDIVKAVAERNGLGHNIQELKDIADEDVLFSQIGTDFQFMNRLAAAHGFSWKVIGRTLHCFRYYVPAQTTGSPYDLCYMCGDYSVRSWEMARKQTGRGGRRRKGTKKVAANVDFIRGTVFRTEADPTLPETMDPQAAPLLDALADPEMSPAAIAALLPDLDDALATPSGQAFAALFPESLAFLAEVKRREVFGRLSELRQQVPEQRMSLPYRAVPANARTARVAVQAAAAEASLDVSGRISLYYATNAIKAGQTVTLWGAGRRFSGPYTVDSVATTFDDSDDAVVAMELAVNRAGLKSKAVTEWVNANPGGGNPPKPEDRNPELTRLDPTTMEPPEPERQVT